MNCLSCSKDQMMVIDRRDATVYYSDIQETSMYIKDMFVFVAFSNFIHCISNAREVKKNISLL